MWNKIKSHLLFPYRLRLAFFYLKDPIWFAIRWAWGAKEHTNLTYHLTEMNRQVLAQFVAEIEGCSYEKVLDLFSEIEKDEKLKKELRLKVDSHSRGWLAEKNPRFGRRVAWYAWIRLRKPKVVIETGVDKGLGASVILRALEKNAAEGHSGKYYGTDINPQAGWMIPDGLRAFGEIWYGDSLISLAKWEGKVDVFINDSDHSQVYEEKEYRLILKKISKNGLIIGDNAHISDALLRFSRQEQRHFYFFSEKPHRHWYPGGGVGVSVE